MLLAWNAAGSGAGGDDLGAGRTHRGLRTPVKLVMEAHFVAGFDRGRRMPEGNDIIEGFVHDWYFNQHQRTCAPVIQGFDPKRRALVIIGPIILIMVEVAVA